MTDKTEQWILNHDRHFRYQLLDRMRTDCDYYLGNGNHSPRYLWAGSAREQIACMKLLWESFSNEEKPEWLSWEVILEYERQMCK